MTIRFFVPGHPKPGGSKRGFYIQKLKRVVITEDCKQSKDWRAVVALKASEACRTPLQCALRVRFEFLISRPKGHYGTRGVRPTAPRFPSVKPDVTKLIRSTEDALTGIVWRDDAQVVSQAASKIYTEGGPGCWIEVQAIGDAAVNGELSLVVEEEF